MNDVQLIEYYRLLWHYIMDREKYEKDAGLSDGGY